MSTSFLATFVSLAHTNPRQDRERIAKKIAAVQGEPKEENKRRTEYTVDFEEMDLKSASSIGKLLSNLRRDRQRKVCTVTTRMWME